MSQSQTRAIFEWHGMRPPNGHQCVGGFQTGRLMCGYWYNRTGRTTTDAEMAQCNSLTVALYHARLWDDWRFYQSDDYRYFRYRYRLL